MSWTQKEKAIQEKRTLEATKKNLMGVTGKFGSIAQILGNPIMQHGGGLFDTNFLDYEEDTVDTEYETTASGQQGPEVFRDELLESEDVNIDAQGYTFSGLSRGMHLEINYWFNNQKIDVTYKGYMVYKEIAGELLAYAPFPEWETLIDKLYKLSKEQSRGVKKNQEKELKEKIQVQKNNFWTRLRYRWGI